MFMIDADYDFPDAFCTATAAVAETLDKPCWEDSVIDEYIPREWLQLNKNGEILITLKHGDVNVLITPEHELYAKVQAIIDSEASISICLRTWS